MQIISIECVSIRNINIINLLFEMNRYIIIFIYNFVNDSKIKNVKKQY